MPKSPIPVPVECFSGYIQMPATGRMQVDFTAPVGATEAATDSAFLKALGAIEGVEYNYLSMGEIVDHNGVTLAADPIARLPDGTEQLVDMFRNALLQGHRYVLCVECPSRSTLRQTNIDAETDVARVLEKFARRAREAA